MKLDPYTTDRAVGFNKAPCSGHPLGTDDVGRDLFARLLYGGRISLFVGIMSTIISVLIGIPLGLIAGYFRGIAETVIMRVADAFMSFPTMVLILVLVPYGHGGDRSPRLDCNRKADLRKCVIDPGT